MKKLMAALLCVAGVVGRAGASSGPQWFEVDSPHFAVVTDANEKEGRKLALEFERMREVFHDLLPYAAGDAGLPIKVMALKDRKGFVALEPAAYLQKGSLPLDGLFLRTADQNYILLRLDTEHEEHPYEVVYHEYTHFVLRKATWLPLWLNEGLAQFYENTDIGDSLVKLGQPSADMIYFLRQQRLLPVETLFRVDYNSPYYHQEDKGSVFYAESWALTHMIEVEDFEHKTHRLQDYAHLMAKDGEDAVTAAQHAFGDLKTLQKQLDSYVSGGSFSMFQIKKAYAVDEKTFTAHTLTLDQANADRADVLANDDRRPEAEALLKTVLADDPKDVQGLETMGSMAFRDTNYKEAMKWYGEAIGQDSKSYFAEFSFGVCTMMLADTSKNAEAEASLRKAIAMEPDFAPAYDALEHLLTIEHKNMGEAHMMGLKAVQLEPEELSYRINVADTLMMDEKPESAISVLQAADKDVAKSVTEHALVQGRIQQIKSYQNLMVKQKAAEDKFRAEQAEAQTTVELGGTERTVVATTDVTTTERTPHMIGTPAKPLPGPMPEVSGSTPNHEAKGVIRNVICAYPKAVVFELEKPGGALTFFTPNMYSLLVTTTNFTLNGSFGPCTQLEGMTATIKYVAAQDKIYAGKAIGIQLSH